MATKPRSYKKGAYTYTESSLGSNKFQNFTAKPTVKEVRDTSRKDKAVVATKKYSATPTSDYRSPKAMPSATPTSDYRSPRSRPSATPTSDYRGTPVRGTPRANRQGGMDTGNVMKARLSKQSTGPVSRGSTGSRYAEIPVNPKYSSGKGLLGSIIDRVTQPTKKLTPASEKILAEARAEITPVVTALAGGRLLYKGGKKIVDIATKAYKGPAKPTPYKLGRNTKPQKVDADNVGRPIEELFKKGKGTPKLKKFGKKPIVYKPQPEKLPPPRNKIEEYLRGIDWSKVGK